MHTIPEYDVLVAGGGIAGAMAAVAAAREGCRTLLVEHQGALGGMATLGLVQPVTTWGVGHHQVIAGTGQRVMESLAQRVPPAATPLSLYGPTCDAEYLKYALETLAIEHNVSLRYYTWVAGAVCREERILALRTFSKAGEQSVSGKVIIDATGDADVASSAGVPCEIGSQGITLMFVVAGVDRGRCPERDAISAIYQAHKVGYRGLALFWHPRPGSAYLNVTEQDGLDSLDPADLTSATLACRRQAWQILDVLQRHVPGFEGAYLEQTAPALGVRESRRIHGCYTLTTDDVLTGRHFADVVARASCPVDIHGNREAGRGRYQWLERSYAIPYRCLTTPSIRNLLVTGRPVSADHGAHSSLRRMAPAFALGEAAGLAAALAAAAHGGDVRQVDIPSLQRALRTRGAILDPEPGHASVAPSDTPGSTHLPAQ